MEYDPKHLSTAAITVYQFFEELFFVFSPHLALLRLSFRAGSEVSSHGVTLARSLGHISFPPAATECKSLVNTHPSRGTPLKEWRKAEEREVIVGSDSGGRCQASFRSLPEKQLLHLLLGKQKNGVLFSYKSNFLKSSS